MKKLFIFPPSLSSPLLPKSPLQPAHRRDTLHLSLLPPLLLLTDTNHIQEPQIFLPLALHSLLLHSWYFTETFGSSFDTKGKNPQQFRTLAGGPSLHAAISNMFLYPIIQIFNPIFYYFCWCVILVVTSIKFMIVLLQCLYSQYELWLLCLVVSLASCIGKVFLVLVSWPKMLAYTSSLYGLAPI